MTNQVCILGDWGTSRFRLFLIVDNQVVDNKNGVGISKLTVEPEQALFDLIAPWMQKFSVKNIYLSGMVGSNIGWKTVPYLPCPASTESLLESRVRFTCRHIDVHIMGGMSCTNQLGSPDLMRGEETQVVGLLHLIDELKQGTHLFCLPGTHTKWVLVKNGMIELFHTALTGELFYLLLNHSVLITEHSHDNEVIESKFIDGVKRSFEINNHSLLHVLFEIRAKQIDQQLESEAASSYLSGLVIGQDILGALSLFKGEMFTKNQFSTKSSTLTPVRLVGEKHLVSCYSKALSSYGFNTIEHDGNAAVIAGLKLMGGKS